MLKALGAIVLVLLLIFAVGYYFGWFTAETKTGESKTEIQIGVNKEKIKEDAQKVKDKGKQIGENVKEKVK